MPHLQHHGTDLCLEAACGSWKACVPSGTWNWVQLAQINLQHCSSGETVRDEHAKPVANCCLSVKIVPSCRDIGEMQWNRCHPCHHDIELAIVESFTAFLHGVLDSVGYHGTEPLLVHFCIFYGSIATMFAHLCLQLRSSTASWYRAYFVSQRADALHWIVRWTWTALRKWAAISGAICTMVLSLVLCDFLAFPLQLTMFVHLCLQLRSPSGAALCERLCVKVLVEASVCKSVCVWKCLHVNVPVCKSVCV